MQQQEAAVMCSWGLPTCVFASMQAAMPLKQQPTTLYGWVGGCFRGMAACMLANTHEGCPQEPMLAWYRLYPKWLHTTLASPT